MTKAFPLLLTLSGDFSRARPIGRSKAIFDEALRNGDAVGMVNLAVLCYELGEKEKYIGLFAGAIRLGFANGAQISKQVSNEEYCMIQTQLTPNKNS